MFVLPVFIVALPPLGGIALVMPLYGRCAGAMH